LAQRTPQWNRRNQHLISDASYTKAIRKLYVIGDEKLVLSKDEGEIAEEVAKRFGLPVKEASELVVKASIARRMKKRTGKNPAKVYGIRRK